MDTQRCKGCSVMVSCIANNGYPLSFCHCMQCEKAYPVTTSYDISAQANMTIGEVFAGQKNRWESGLAYVDIGPQVHIPLVCPLGLRPLERRRFICRTCIQKARGEMHEEAAQRRDAPR